MFGEDDDVGYWGGRLSSCGQWANTWRAWAWSIFQSSCQLCGPQGPVKTNGVVSPKEKVAHGYEKNTAPYERLGKTLAHPNKHTGKHQPYRWLTLEEKRERQEKGLCFRCHGRGRTISVSCKPYMFIWSMRMERRSLWGRTKNGWSRRGSGGTRASRVIIDFAGGDFLTQYHESPRESDKATNNVLIDSGVSHNFISMNLVRKLLIPLQGTTDYGVLMGVGIAVKREGICKGLKL